MASRSVSCRNFDEVLAELDRLQLSGYSKAGNWSLGEVCEHLGIGLRSSLEECGIPRANWLMRMFVAPLFLRIVLKSGRMRPGIKVPGQLLPKGLEDDAQAIQSFRSLVKRFESHTGEFRPHPFFGSISPENTRRLHLIHANHHLGFLIPAS